MNRPDRRSPSAADLRSAERFRSRVLSAVRRIPYGKVASYGDIAAMVGFPRSARGVGRVLSQLPQGSDVPWWRVVNHAGNLSIPAMGRPLQRVLLLEEGVSFRSNGSVEMKRFRWDGGAGRSRKRS